MHLVATLMHSMMFMVTAALLEYALTDNHKIFRYFWILHLQTSVQNLIFITIIPRKLSKRGDKKQVRNIMREA